MKTAQLLWGLPIAGAVGLGVPVHGVLAPQLGERLVRDGVDERVVVGEVDVVQRRGGVCHPVDP